MEYAHKIHVNLDHSTAQSKCNIDIVKTVLESLKLSNKYPLVDTVCIAALTFIWPWGKRFTLGFNMIQRGYLAL